jgi:predicted helicase
MSIHAIHQYQNEVEKIIQFGGTRKETAIRNAFYHLLNEYAKQRGLMIVTEVTIKTPTGKNVTPDGTLKDMLRQDWGYWESKDESDIIDDEIKKKFDKGYPKENILFEDSQIAVLFQNGIEVMRVSVKDADALHHLLNKFISYERPEVRHFRKAIEHFKEDIPKVTETIRTIIIEQETTNPKYIKAAEVFLKLCHDSINPDITIEDVREMIIQHILTEDIFNTIFDETQFHRENNIARELETVIHTFFTGNTRRVALSGIQHYYQAINAAAAGIADHHEKQKFLKVVYETFYKSYNPKAADRLGVIYTPNEVVRFMIESTDYLLHKHFNKLLEDKNVEILDPATGTGTFICDMIDYLRKEKLEYKYKHEIHANEVAILPYYISNLNIEFTYAQKMGKYTEFENLCFVDTLDNMGFTFRGKQIDMFAPFTEENSKRIKKQNDRKIAVIIGNPPYNAKQGNYNSQNSNRTYKAIDERIKNTYAAYGSAQNKNQVYDMYFKFFRWATDRVSENGIVCFVTNRSFIDAKAFDGIRKSFTNDYDFIYVIDLKGDITNKNDNSLPTGNIFGIKTGVAIAFLIKTNSRQKNPCIINYSFLSDELNKEEKLEALSELKFKEIDFERIVADKNESWINQIDNDFGSLLPLIDKNVKSGKSKKALFQLFSRGIATQRDEWVYDFDERTLENKINYMVCAYQDTLKDKDNKNKFSIKWDRELDKYLVRGIKKQFDKTQLLTSLYRPYVKKSFYFDKHFNGMTYRWNEIFQENFRNRAIGFISGIAKPFSVLAFDTLIDLNGLSAASGGTQCLPLFRYDNKGNRFDNISDWGLNQFVKQYGKKGVNKEAIFYYVYGVLQSPVYQKKYEINLKREFPRIPFYEDFKRWAEWGKQLMDLHINYETLEPYELDEITTDTKENPKAKLKADKEKGIIVIDENTVLKGIPKEAWTYKLGNRSALEWILDQYKESKPKDPTIAEKFNTYKFADYKSQVIDLLKRVCTVSVKTMEIITAMETVTNNA